MCSESNDAPAPVGVEKEADVLRLSGDLDAFALAIFRQSGVLAPAPHLFFLHYSFSSSSCPPPFRLVLILAVGHRPTAAPRVRRLFPSPHHRHLL